jgi:hypothetical protein
MATRRKATRTRATNEAIAPDTTGKGYAAQIARTSLRPTVQAAITLAAYGKSMAELDTCSLLDALDEQMDACKSGDLQRAEDMLAAQAHTLDGIFNSLARRALQADYVDHFERYLKLALRAQSQARMTWEALATIKNPPMMGYVQQANIAHGPQQVNNNTATSRDCSRADEIQNQPNKLLEEQHGERLDTGAASAAGRVDTSVEAVGIVHGPEDT